MNWRLKMGIRRCLLALPRGEQLYRWLTVEALRTQAGMVDKWFRVFPTHIRVLQEQFGTEARDQRMWCFDSGATLAAGLAMTLSTDEPAIMTNRVDRLSDRYLALTRQLLLEKGPALAQPSRASTDRLDHLLAMTEGKSSRAALAAIGVTFASTHSAVEGQEWQGKIGCVFSAGALEHYSPESLETEMLRMARALKPSGVMSHVVDHRDHRWHADKRLSPLAHLTIDEEAYRRRFGNPLDYHNRWLRSRYVELFGRHGFTVDCRDVIRYTPDLPGLDRDNLASPFEGTGEDDLQSLVTHFVAIRM